jgi:tetratricopeptide (TPR) repeat protein
MKKLIMLFLFLSIYSSFSQASLTTTYDSVLGFRLNLGETWSKTSKNDLFSKLKKVENLKTKHIFDLDIDNCFHKASNNDKGFPYFIVKTIYKTSEYEDKYSKAMEKLQKFISQKSEIQKNNIDIKDTSDINIEVEKYYKESTMKVILNPVDIGRDSKGELIVIIGLYFGKNASFMVMYCDYKDEYHLNKSKISRIFSSVKDISVIMITKQYLDTHNKAIQFYNDGVKSSNSEDAVKLFTKAIETYPKEDSVFIASAFYNRAISKKQLREIDLNDIVEDYTQSIEYDPFHYQSYTNRGYIKFYKNDCYGAIDDFVKVIKFDNYISYFSSIAIGNKGLAMLTLRQDGCPYLKEAIDLGNQKVIEIYKNTCEKK